MNKNHTNPLFKMTISGIMLGFSIAVMWLGQTFFKWGAVTYLNIDVSIVFVIPLLWIANKKYAYSVGILQGLMSFVMTGGNASFGGWVGPIILISTNVLLLTLAWLIYPLVKKIKMKIIWQIILLYVIIALLISLLLVTLNGVLLIPVYSYIYAGVSPGDASIMNFSSLWNENDSVLSDARWLLLDIPNYWTGIWSIFAPFNLAKYGIVSFLLINIHFMLVHAGYISKT